ncbi:MAG: YgiQ family radical SAM protein, partial [Spirochaetota bacterium]|nr:YgiQ family radical SAM protein [Spirochaetota bacterium]
MAGLGWEMCDFVLVTGDAYVDHPSFGAAVIGRSLEAEGFRVGIIAQPDWKDPESLRVLGRPRLGFLITSGNMDSMVNHYTAARRLRHDDAYSPGGRYGKRPDRAVIVYANLARAAYKGVPVILGGIEASLRRLGHYDYWSDKLRRSVLLDAKADLLLYGMAERSIRRAARILADGGPLTDLRGLRGAVYRLTRREMEESAAGTSPGLGEGTTAGAAPDSGADGGAGEWNCIRLPSFDEAAEDKAAFARSFAIQMENADPYSASALIEPAGGMLVVQNPPDYPLSREELDAVYELPYARRAHPSY